MRPLPRSAPAALFAAAAVSAAGLAALALAAPLLEWARSPLAASAYWLLGAFCHQRPSRSWFLLGSQVGLCVRTFSFYATLGVAALAASGSAGVRAALGTTRAALGAWAVLPLLVDGAGQGLGLWASSPLSRAVTGVLAGLGLVRVGLGGRVLVRPARRLAGAAVPVVLALGLAFPPPLLAQARSAALRVGTPVFLVTGEELTSATLAAGQRVQLRVLRDVTVNGATVIAAGAPATAVVEEVYRAESWGKRGALSLRIEDVEAVDGQRVPLAATQQAEGESKEKTAAVTAIVTGVLCLPLALTGFLFKGGEGAIPKGSEVKAFTAADATIRPSAASAAR